MDTSFPPSPPVLDRPECHEALYFCVYASAATVLFEEGELLALLRTCRDRNAQLGITGLLLYHEGNFIQLLEGPEHAVLPLVETIRHDPRHTGMTVLLQGPTPERVFPHWAMGFKHIERLLPQAEAGGSAFLDRAVVEDAFAGKPPPALVLLRSFRTYTL